LAAKVAFLPHELTSEIVGGVTFPVYARLQSNVREATKAFRAIFTGTLFVMAPLFSLLFVLAPSLVSNVLGPKWEGTIPLVQSLAIVGLLRLIADATVPVLKGLGLPYKFTILEGVQTILLISFVWVFITYFGLAGVGYAWFPAGAGTLIISCVFLRQSLQHPFKGLGKPLITIVLASVTGGLTALIIDRTWPGLLGVSLAILAAIGMIGSLLWVSNRALVLEFKNHFLKSCPKAATLLPGFER